MKIIIEIDPDAKIERILAVHAILRGMQMGYVPNKFYEMLSGDVIRDLKFEITVGDARDLKIVNDLAKIFSGKTS